MQDLAKQHAVSSMPTFMAFLNGKKVDTIVGANVGKMEELIKQCAPARLHTPMTTHTAHCSQRCCHARTCEGHCTYLRNWTHLFSVMNRVHLSQGEPAPFLR